MSEYREITLQKNDATESKIDHPTYFGYIYHIFLTNSQLFRIVRNGIVLVERIGKPKFIDHTVYWGPITKYARTKGGTEFFFKRVSGYFPINNVMFYYAILQNRFL